MLSQVEDLTVSMQAASLAMAHALCLRCPPRLLHYVCRNDERWSEAWRRTPAHPWVVVHVSLWAQIYRIHLLGTEQSCVIGFEAVGGGYFKDPTRFVPALRNFISTDALMVSSESADWAKLATVARSLGERIMNDPALRRHFDFQRRGGPIHRGPGDDYGLQLVMGQFMPNSASRMGLSLY